MELATGALSITGEALAVVPGAVSTTLNTAVLTATGLYASPEVITPQYVLVATAVLVASAVRMTPYTPTPATYRRARYYTPMVFEEVDENGIRRSKFWLFEDGSEILWGTK